MDRTPPREAWGIRRWGSRYRQGCLTAKRPAGTPHDRACELFAGRPLAVLPLGQGTFQVVWSAPGNVAGSAARCSAVRFSISWLPFSRGIEPILLDQPRASLSNGCWPAASIVDGAY